MNIKYSVLVLLLLLSVKAVAFQCSSDNSFSVNFAQSERVFLIYVTEVSLDKKTTKRNDKEYPESAGYVKILKVDYDVVENFKGDIEFIPKFMDLLGIGTGYVGFTPGNYYMVTLSAQGGWDKRNYRHVSMCDVHFQHYRNDIDEYKAIVEEARALAGDENA